MDNFGDFFYVIIAIAWLIFGYLGQKKKKEAQRRKEAQSNPTPTAQPVEEKKSFSTILDEILKEAQAKEAAKKEKKVEKAPQAFKPVETPKPYEFGHYETMEDDIVDEEAAYEGFGTDKYKHETLEDITEQNAIYNENQSMELKRDEHYRTDRATTDDDDDFDIEKAVIFSEILRRPQF